MNAARGYLNLAFFTEYVRDLPKRPTATTEFADEFAVRLQPGARRFVGQTVEDFLESGIHGQGARLPLLYLKKREQSLDVNLINT